MEKFNFVGQQVQAPNLNDVGTALSNIQGRLQNDRQFDLNQQFKKESAIESARRYAEDSVFRREDLDLQRQKMLAQLEQNKKINASRAITDKLNNLRLKESQTKSTKQAQADKDFKTIIKSPLYNTQQEDTIGTTISDRFKGVLQQDINNNTPNADVIASIPTEESGRALDTSIKLLEQQGVGKTTFDRLQYIANQGGSPEAMAAQYVLSNNKDNNLGIEPTLNTLDTLQNDRLTNPQTQLNIIADEQVRIANPDVITPIYNATSGLRWQVKTQTAEAVAQVKEDNALRRTVTNAYIKENHTIPTAEEISVAIADGKQLDNTSSSGLQTITSDEVTKFKGVVGEYTKQRQAIDDGYSSTLATSGFTVDSPEYKQLAIDLNTEKLKNLESSDQAFSQSIGTSLIDKKVNTSALKAILGANPNNKFLEETLTKNLSFNQKLNLSKSKYNDSIKKLELQFKQKGLTEEHKQTNRKELLKLKQDYTDKRIEAKFGNSVSGRKVLTKAKAIKELQEYPNSSIITDEQLQKISNATKNQYSVADLRNLRDKNIAGYDKIKNVKESIKLRTELKNTPEYNVNPDPTTNTQTFAVEDLKKKIKSFDGKTDKTINKVFDDQLYKGASELLSMSEKGRKEAVLKIADDQAKMLSNAGSDVIGKRGLYSTYLGSVSVKPKLSQFLQDSYPDGTLRGAKGRVQSNGTGAPALISNMYQDSITKLNKDIVQASTKALSGLPTDIQKVKDLKKQKAELTTEQKLFENPDSEKTTPEYWVKEFTNRYNTIAKTVEGKGIKGVEHKVGTPKSVKDRLKYIANRQNDEFNRAKTEREVHNIMSKYKQTVTSLTSLRGKELAIEQYNLEQERKAKDRIAKIKFAVDKTAAVDQQKLADGVIKRK